MQRQGEETAWGVCRIRAESTGEEEPGVCWCEEAEAELEGTCLSHAGLALTLEVAERSVILGKMKGKLQHQLPP